MEIKEAFTIHIRQITLVEFLLCIANGLQNLIDLKEKW